MTSTAVWYCIVCQQPKKADQYNEDQSNENSGLETICKQCKQDAQNQPIDQPPGGDVYTAPTGLAYVTNDFNTETQQVTGTLSWIPVDPAPGMGYTYSLYNLTADQGAGVSGVYTPYVSWNYLAPNSNYRVLMHSQYNFVGQSDEVEFFFTTPADFTPQQPQG